MSTKMKEKLGAAAIRALHTMAQTALGVIGAGVVLSDVDWVRVLSAAALAGVISLLKSIAVGMPEIEED